MNKRKRKNNKWASNRYGEYYFRLMTPVYTENYQKYIKRIKALKKKIIALGEIPQNEKQMIKTIQYFVGLINLATNFVDEGILNYGPIEKKEELKEFNNAIITMTCRSEEIPQIENRAPLRGKVTVNNLSIGVMWKAKEGESLGSNKKVIKNGAIYYVEVEPIPAIDWINSKAIAVNGRSAHLMQHQLAELEEKMKGILLENIDAVLRE